jgi:small subunit ribosomal protein S6
MRQYEIVVIVHPELDEAALNDVVKRIEKWITDDGGEISNIEMWGKKKLAYPIKKQNEGQYALLQVNIAPAFCSQLERNLRFLEPVMRYLLVSY